jgi:hypothetical protein
MQCPYNAVCTDCPWGSPADCSDCDNFKNQKGLKFDNDKPRWDLLPLKPIEDIVKVLTFGAKKYGPDNWRQVENAKDRYFAALMRHLVAWRAGEKIDSESSMPHIAHALCNLVFLYELEGADDKE